MRLIVSVSVFCQGTIKIQYLFYPLSAMILHPSPYGFYTCKFYLRFGRFTTSLLWWPRENFTVVGERGLEEGVNDQVHFNGFMKEVSHPHGQRAGGRSFQAFAWLNRNGNYAQSLSAFRLVCRIACFRCDLIAENLRAIFPRFHKTCSRHLPLFHGFLLIWSIGSRQSLLPYRKVIFSP